MNRSPAQKMNFVAAVLCTVAPLGFGLFRAGQTAGDFRMTWMALAATIFAGSVLATAIGKRRSRHATMIQSLVIFFVATALAGGTGYALGATAGPGVWMVAIVLSFFLAVANVLFEFSRPSVH